MLQLYKTIYIYETVTEGENPHSDCLSSGLFHYLERQVLFVWFVLTGTWLKRQIK